MSLPIPDNEQGRLAALAALRVLDTGPEERFDRVTRLASELFDMPTALVSLVDRDRQWFKSCLGLDAPETPRDVAFCAHAIMSTEVMVVEDTAKDPRFADNALVTGAPNIRFYAGAPLVTEAGHGLSTLCVIDYKPRSLSDQARRQLVALSHVVRDELELRQALFTIRDQAREVQKVNDQLARVNQAQERFIQAAAHDLRAPLRTIDAFGTMLSEDLGPEVDPKATRYLGHIMTAAGRMARLLSDLLDYAKLKAAPASPTVTSLADAANMAIANLDSAIRECGAQVQYGPLPTIVAVESQMVQVFQNLIGNALKFRRPGVVPTVAIEATTEAPAQPSEPAVITISVTDNGKGFEPGHADQIFIPFQRLASQDSIEGSGLGLAICYHIIERHGGSMSATGKPDAFARISFTVPARQI